MLYVQLWGSFCEELYNELAMTDLADAVNKDPWLGLITLKSAIIRYRKIVLIG